jgi:hypothetical protein
VGGSVDVGTPPGYHLTAAAAGVAACARCKYFKFGEGTCPFAVGGTLQGAGGCMFAHCDREGRPIEENRLYMGEDGELQRIRT